MITLAKPCLVNGIINSKELATKHLVMDQESI